MTPANDPSESNVVRTLHINDKHLGLPGELNPEATYDVLLNDLHVWSFQTERDTTARAGRLIAPWPKALRRYLDGTAVVVVRDTVSGTVIASAEHVFGDDPSRLVSVTDKGGHPLVLDKYGRLTRPLSAERAEDRDDFLAQVDALMTTLKDDAGVASFVTYGTLLGAVRDGKLIGHDNDVDIAYLSEHSDPVDVVREAFRIERVLTEKGWVVRRGSGTRVNVRITQPDGSIRFVDVFTAHWVDGVFYMPSDTGFRVPREAILPLSTVEIHGRAMPAPADPEPLLAATYGPGWATPDPSFKYETPRWLARRLNGWFGGLRVDRKVWDAFYAKSGRKLPKGPSDFARWVAQAYPSDRPLVDLGSGTGRDAVWFARKQHREVTAIDYSLGVMNRSAAANNEHGVRHEVLNFNDLRHVYSLGARLSRLEQPVDLYGRFLLHALDDHGRDHVLRLASLSLRRGGHLFLEFRTDRDRNRSHEFANPRRQFLRPADVVAQIEAAGGRIVEQVAGDGLAVFGTENPHVCRIVASWSDRGRSAPEPLHDPAS